MIKIEIVINTNASEEEKKDLILPMDALTEFLGDGYGEDSFEGNVSFKCLPRAIGPEILDILISIKEYAEDLCTLGASVTALVKFIRRCIGYKPMITIRKVDTNDKEELYTIEEKYLRDEKNLLNAIIKIFKK